MLSLPRYSPKQVVVPKKLSQRSAIDSVPHGISDEREVSLAGLRTQWSFSSVQFSCSVMSDSLRFHGLLYTKPPCPSPTHGVHSNSCPLSWWCHPTISSSVVPFSSRIQSFPASGSFQMSQLFASGDYSIGVSASASVLPKPMHSMNNIMKLRFFKSYYRKNSVREKAIGKQWICLDRCKFYR